MRSKLIYFSVFVSLVTYPVEASLLNDPSQQEKKDSAPSTLVRTQKSYSPNSRYEKRQEDCRRSKGKNREKLKHKKTIRDGVDEYEASLEEGYPSPISFIKLNDDPDVDTVDSLNNSSSEAHSDDEDFSFTLCGPQGKFNEGSALSDSECGQEAQKDPTISPLHIPIPTTPTRCRSQTSKIMPMAPVKPGSIQHDYWQRMSEEKPKQFRFSSSAPWKIMANDDSFSESDSKSDSKSDSENDSENDENPTVH